MSDALFQVARNWAEHDPDPVTRDEILALVDAGDEEALEKLRAAFNGPLTFGTAGLRAAVGAGESRLNRAVVIRTTSGLMTWLNNQVDHPVVVLGCDARHGSEDFLDSASRVVAAAGGRALVLPAKNPTPLTAFSVKKLGADAGVMITASHNPPADNGYKVYLGGRIATGDAEGVQLISPSDTEIAAAIDAAPCADEVGLAPRDAAAIEHIDTREDYIQRDLQLAGDDIDPGEVTIALTAMHGVGAVLGQQLLTTAGFKVSLVPEQADPDPDFPTVAFPNPEEKGALDLAKAHAAAIGADVIIAYDPDADRCALATPDSAADGGWRQLSGDETGALLGEYIASRGEVSGAFANSVVSSRLLSKIAQHHGLEHRTTLTGFKWIARTRGLAYGYEEALGYCCDPDAVSDKDGISASIIAASLVASLKKQGKTLDDALADLARTYGLYQTQPLTFRVSDTSQIVRAMKLLRDDRPTSFAGSEVISVTDLAEDELGIGITDALIFTTAADDRIICRPSGTEPKLKCYLEVVVPVDGQDVPREQAKQRLDTIAAELAERLGM